MLSDENSPPNTIGIGEKRRQGALQLGARKKPCVAVYITRTSTRLIFWQLRHRSPRSSWQTFRTYRPRIMYCEHPPAQWLAANGRVFRPAG
jgi:hypothetical protein